MIDKNDTRMKRLGYRPPADVPEPDQLVLVEYVSGGRVAVITLNRPHADNAITTELAAQLIEILETIAARPSVRCAILTGSGDRAFSVGGDLYQRKNMTKEEWLRQRQVFDRVRRRGRSHRAGVDNDVSITSYLAERLPVPVVNPALVGYLQCESLLDMSLCHSKRSYPAPEVLNDAVLSSVPNRFS